MATAKVQIYQVQKNKRLTNPIDEEDPEETTFNKTGYIINLAFVGVEITVTSGNIYIDQTGLFPEESSKGTKYVFVLYFYDANAIITETLKEITGI